MFIALLLKTKYTTRADNAYVKNVKEFFCLKTNIYTLVISIKRIPVSFANKVHNKSKLITKKFLPGCFCNNKRDKIPKKKNNTSCVSAIYSAASLLIGCTKKMRDK